MKPLNEETLERETLLEKTMKTLNNDKKQTRDVKDTHDTDEGDLIYFIIRTRLVCTLR